MNSRAGTALTSAVLPPNRLMVRLYRLGLGIVAGRLILLLTTTGRKTGYPRVTPLQYEKMDDAFVVASGTGSKSDWIRNLCKDPHVQVEIGRRKFEATAEIISDAEKVCDFLELRLKRHPLMIGAILHSEGLSFTPGRAELLDYSRGRTMVRLFPVNPSSSA